MTKILLLSDTHGHLDERILAYVAEADRGKQEHRQQCCKNITKHKNVVLITN